ncbi:MAG: DUF1049 domain-containing protein [Desulfuromonadales bacterium]|nr:DUF1049 domain-containing protein [Desulfuromonadales bacterium]
MTVMAFLLLIILFLVSFLYFSGLNPQEITVYYLPDQSVTFSVAIIVIGCIVLGLILGYLAHLYTTVSHLLKHWKRDREEKRGREVAVIYREGVLRLLSGDLKKAHAQLQRALDRDPSRLETYIALATVHVQEGDPQEGITVLQRARSLDPRSLEVLFKLAATYEETGRSEEAMRVNQEILVIEGDNRRALRSLRDLQIRRNDWKEALELQKRLIKASSGTRRHEEEKEKLHYLRYEVAQLELAAGNSEQAINECKEISKEAPAFVPARVTLGDAYQAQNRTAEAANVWQTGYRELGRSIFLSRLEDLYVAVEDPATLLGFYRSALLEKGDDLMLRLFFGKLCLRLEMVDEALEQLYTVESAGVDFPELHYLLAEAHRRRNRLDEAISEYKKAVGGNHRPQLTYQCESCGATTPGWQSRCGDCGTWGSLTLASRLLLTNARPPELREIHHGEREEWSQ